MPYLLKDVKSLVTSAQNYELMIFKDSLMRYIICDGASGKKPIKFYDSVKGRKAVINSRGDPTLGWCSTRCILIEGHPPSTVQLPLSSLTLVVMFMLMFMFTCLAAVMF
jgi:hypothetical protein